MGGCISPRHPYERDVWARAGKIETHWSELGQHFRSKPPSIFLLGILVLVADEGEAMQKTRDELLTQKESYMTYTIMSQLN